jgi:hypothetical protein
MPQIATVDRGSADRAAPRLRTFDRTAQDYGTYISGYQWDLYGCGTYRTRATIESATRQLYTYFDRLRQSIKAPVAWIAVPERRTSGLGFPAIALHWHFVMAAPPRYRHDLQRHARLLWKEYCGDSKIEPYVPQLPGTFYLSKLAAGVDFDFHLGGMERMRYTGPADLFAHAQTDPYVPDHVRHLTSCRTLVLR